MECIKLSVEEVDGRAGGGGHLSVVLRAVPSSNDDLMGVQGAAKVVVDDIMIINYCRGNANAFYV